MLSEGEEEIFLKRLLKKYHTETSNKRNKKKKDKRLKKGVKIFF